MKSDLDGLIAGVLLQRLARKLFQADFRLKPTITITGSSATCAKSPPG